MNHAIIPGARSEPASALAGLVGGVAKREIRAESGVSSEIIKQMENVLGPPGPCPLPLPLTSSSPGAVLTRDSLGVWCLLAFRHLQSKPAGWPAGWLCGWWDRRAESRSVWTV